MNKKFENNSIILSGLKDKKNYFKILFILDLGKINFKTDTYIYYTILYKFCFIILNYLFIFLLIINNLL